MIVLYYIGITIAAIIGAFFLYLFVVAVVPGFSVPEQRFEKTVESVIGEGAAKSGIRRDVNFNVLF